MSIALPSCVLDASALLALLQGEPGAEAVKTVSEGAVVSSVNRSEVAHKSLGIGAWNWTAYEATWKPWG